MLAYLTKSEIHAVMTGGFATIAGSVLAAYILFGVSIITSASLCSFCHKYFIDFYNFPFNVHVHYSLCRPTSLGLLSLLKCQTIVKQQ